MNPYFLGLNIHESQLFWCENQGILCGFWPITMCWTPGPPSLQRCVRRLATTLFAPRLPRCFLRGEHRPRLAMMNVMIHHDVMCILGINASLLAPVICLAGQADMTSYPKLAFAMNAGEACSYKWKSARDVSTNFVPRTYGYMMIYGYARANCLLAVDAVRPSVCLKSTSWPVLIDTIHDVYTAMNLEQHGKRLSAHFYWSLSLYLFTHVQFSNVISVTYYIYIYCFIFSRNESLALQLLICIQIV